MKYLVTKDDIVNESIAEVSLLRMEIAGLDDESLIDEVMYISAEVDLLEEVDKTISRFFKKGKLNKKERAMIESAYLLFHIEHCTEE